MQIVKTVEMPGIPLAFRGKVRDIFAVEDMYLLVTTDRMSAFDVNMAEPVPYKGVVLNQITLFWMEMCKDLVANHLLVSRVEDFPQTLLPHAAMLEGRSVLAKRARPLPIECVVRGYLSGSGWQEYAKKGSLCGQPLPAGLEESAQLERPLFTPSTKAPLGQHDESINEQGAMALLAGMVPDGGGEALFQKVRDISLALYARGSEHAAKHGLIIADTKFEFGLVGDELVLIDEVLTPDSSRFWPAEGYTPGKGQPSFDKQYLRDWLNRQDWDKTPPAPALPEEVVLETAARYARAFSILTGKDLDCLR